MKKLSLSLRSIPVGAALLLAACAPQQAKVDATTVEVIPKQAAVNYLRKNHIPFAAGTWDPCIVTDDSVVMGTKTFRFAELRTRMEYFPIHQRTNIELLEKGLFPTVCAYYRTPDGQEGKDTETIDKIGTALMSLGVEVDTK